MAQRSARARVKLDKISASGSPSLPSTTSHSRTGSKGVAKIGSGGLLTPSVSSVSGSSRGSIQLSHSGPKIGKSALRSFFDSHSEKIRGRLSSGSGLGKKDVHQSGYGLGLGLGLGGGMLSLGEKIEVKRWEGGGRREELWEGGGQGRKDLELWFPDGDTLVYLTERPIIPRNPQGLYKPPPPKASFRLHSSILRKTESPFLIAALEGSFRERPLTPPRYTGANGSDDGISPTSMEFEYQLGSQKKSSKSDANSEEGVQYRLYFPAQMGGDKLATHKHHLTTRNFFAVLFNKALVGMTLGQTLLDLVDRMDLYLSPPNPLNYDLLDHGVSEIESPYGSLMSPKGQMSTQKIIIDYLKDRDFDDVRNWAEGAAGLVVWAERASASGALSCGLGGGEMVGGVESLWREGFVHCTGMLARLEGGGEWRDISPITKALIDRASLEIQVRVAGADQRLSNFNFTDMWPTTSSAAPHARAAFDKFQKFLVKHYSSRFGSWPPHTPDGRLSRMVYVQLQRDFSALYDYLVDRDVSWSNSNAQTHHPRQNNTQGVVVNKPNNTVAGNKLVNHKSPHWRADDEELHITDILITFDEKQNYPHMPYPFPLVPPPMVMGRGFKNRFFQGARRGSITNTPTSAFTTPATADKAAALSLSESTNIMSLMSSSVSNDLVDAFAKHEKSISASEIDPHDARKGRWILIYGILQTLATVAVDAPGIRYTEGVDYFLCPKLRGTPPWKYGGERGMDSSGLSGSSMADERSHFRSHCWTVPRTWRLAEPLPSTAAVPNYSRDDNERETSEVSGGRMNDIESGDDGDDEMGDVESSPVMGGGLGRKKSKRYDSISSGSGLGSPVLMENKVRWQDAWGMGPQGTPGRMGGGPYYH